ncbi:hypothetical protein QFC19_002553 [Naganishia cerealis]|uniref:Uncharacterized protein n=1 Tax=Naganishia cerealis TaxID=610337 RepID=A0ACC2W9G6_9TREE|nr:hypothetical protein QFC19_002553 [Naganishia cerealis]
MQPHYMDHDAQDSVVIVGEEQGQEEEEEEDRALEMSVKSLKENDGLPVIRGEELGKVVVPDLLGRRPTLVSRLSHLSINSTETTTEGNSSGGGTLSVNSEEMGLDMHTAIPQVLSSTKSSTASEDAKEDPVPVSHCEGVSKLTKSDPADISPVSDGSGTVFASTKGEDVDSNISRPLSRTAQPFDAGLLDLPSLASTSTSSVTGSSDVQELRSEDAMHDWHHNKEKEQYRHVHEHRQGMKKRSRFRSPAVTAYQAPDHLPFAIYFGSKSTRDASTKGKERDRIPADDFDVLHRDFSSSETQRRAKRTGQDRQTSPQSHHSGTSSEHERAKFDAAIREHQKAVHFQPLAIRPKKPIKAAESSTSAATPERGQQRESKPIVSNTTSSPRHSPRIDSQQGTPGLSRRPSAKRAQSHTMSWDMALLSPAPQRESVEENKLDRENKAKGSVMSLGDAALNLNIIEQAFTAAIDSNSAVAVSGGAPYGSESHPHPTSPSATTISSASSAGSRHRFRSYNGPVLPEIQASTTHAELFYLAFGNGGSSSRQSLIGHTVQKKLERAENDKADRELRATDKAERDERRKHPYNDDFERPVNDDSTTESQSESVTETVESSPMSEPVDKVSKEDEIGEAKERRRKRREAKESRREAKTPSPEPIISAAVIMPLTGMTILTKDGDAITNEPETPSTATINRLNSGLSRNSQASVHAQSTASPRSNVHHGPKIQNSGDTLRPHGTFTTARHPTMAIHADAIRARALISDERFDTINTDQLRAAADAGDQIAEEHLRQRERRSRLLASQGIPPADSKQAEPPSRRRTGITDGGPRRKSSVESAISNSSRKPASPVMQTIQENGAANVK